MTTVDKLKNSLKSISDDFSELIGEVPIKHTPDGHGFRIYFPEYNWMELNSEQKNIQIQIKRKFDRTYEVIRTLLHNSPNDIATEIEEAEKNVRIWLEFDKNFSITSDTEENEQNFRKDVKAVEQIIEILSSGQDKSEIIIPDTNSLYVSIDPVEYRQISNSDSFTFLLLPTVLGELDDHKILHRNPDIREKAKKCIRKIKGWRNQGSLQDGVKVDRNIKVIATHQEPDMNNTLSWLDRENNDDRLIALALSVQSEYTSSRVVLVTGDINLQNKADASFIETDEIHIA